MKVNDLLVIRGNDSFIVMIFLSRLGLVDRSWFRAKRKYVMVAGFIFGAIITPGPDVLSQLSIAIPFVILYEIGILGCGLLGRGRSEKGQNEKPG